MKNAGIILVVGVLALVGIGTMWYINGLNRVVRMDEAVTEAWAQIDTQLQRRSDLIPNLVETVKGYAKHEKEVFTHIANARAALAGAKTVTDKIKAANALEGALSRLLVVVERYPDLKANETFQRLMDELAGTENRIAVARMRYNRAVKEFNSYIREVFGRFFATKRGVDKPRPYFEIEEKTKKEIPQVKF